MGSKKDKKDKKDKKEKKSKHSKKDRKSNKSEKRERSNKSQSRQDAAEDELVLLLNMGIIQQPKLITDLCEIMKSLDDGEYVDVSNISNTTTKAFLTRLMKHIPVVYDHSNGWYKESQHTNVSSYVHKRLSDCGAVRPANELSMSESLSSKNVMLKLLELLNSFPDLKEEFGGLVETLLDGNGVQLESLDNEDIRDGLESLFKAIGLENSREGYSVPEGKKGQLVSEALQHIRHVFVLFESWVVSLSNHNNVASMSNGQSGRRAADDSSDSESSKSSAHRKADDASSSSESEASEKEDAGVGVGVVPSVAPVAVKGPSMPTLSDLQSARALIEQQRRSGALNPADYEDSSDDDYGPQLVDPRTARALQALQAAQPLGFAEAADPSFARAFEADEFGIDRAVEKYNGEAHQVAEADKREEWILTPGDSKAAASMTGAGLTNRKFNAGKQAKKLAEQMSIQREFQRQQQQLQLQQESAERKGPTAADATGGGGNSANLRPVEDVMQDYRELRGGSLMEQHLAKKARTSEAEPAFGKDGKPIRRAFDREKDMLSHSKMDEQKVAKLVQNAKELDDRFDKACVQKSFL